MSGRLRHRVATLARMAGCRPPGCSSPLPARYHYGYAKTRPVDQRAMARAAL